MAKLECALKCVGYNINKNLNGFAYLEVHKEVYNIYRILHFFKKEMKFYDVHLNLNYFVRLC